MMKVDVYIPNISKYFKNCIEEKHSAKDKVMIGRKYFYTGYHKILTADRAKICCWIVSSSLLSTHGGTAASTRFLMAKKKREKQVTRVKLWSVDWKNEKAST